MRTTTLRRARATLPRRLLTAVTVLTVAGSGLLLGDVAKAQTTSGTLTISDKSDGTVLGTGSDVTVINVTTSSGCTEPGTVAAPADGYNVVVTGPGVFAPAPPARPDGLIVVQTGDLGFSTTDAITYNLRSNFRDLAAELGGTVVPGDYVLTFRCVNQFDGIVYQTFSATLTFSSPTSFTVKGGTAATPTPTPAATTTSTTTATTTATTTTTTSTDTTTTSTDTTTATATSDSTTTDTTSGSATATTDSSSTPTIDPTGSTGSGSTGTGTTTSSGTLAYTGAPVDQIVLAGLGLVALGAGLLRAGRRRGLRG